MPVLCKYLPFYFSLQLLYIKGSQKMCYFCTVKHYSLELYLQFIVRALFSLFWHGSRFKMSNGKLQPFINEDEGVIFYCKTLGFWMIVNYHRQNYSHCTPQGLFPSQRRKREIVKFVFLLNTVYLETPNMSPCFTLLLDVRHFSLKVLNCEIQISVTHNVVQSTVESTVWFMPREGTVL